MEQFSPQGYHRKITNTRLFPHPIQHNNKKEGKKMKKIKDNKNQENEVLVYVERLEFHVIQLLRLYVE